MSYWGARVRSRPAPVWWGSTGAGSECLLVARTFARPLSWELRVARFHCQGSRGGRETHTKHSRQILQCCRLGTLMSTCRQFQRCSLLQGQDFLGTSWVVRRPATATRRQLDRIGMVCRLPHSRLACADRVWWVAALEPACCVDLAHGSPLEHGEKQENECSLPSTSPR